MRKTLSKREGRLSKASSTRSGWLEEASTSIPSLPLKPSSSLRKTARLWSSTKPSMFSKTSTHGASFLARPKTSPIIHSSARLPERSRT